MMCVCVFTNGNRDITFVFKNVSVNPEIKINKYCGNYACIN